MNEVRFTKLQGLGNDFLIIEVDDVRELENPSKTARLLCERNYGAGADGIVYVARETGKAADFASRIFNADGSEAEISGNGTRCVAGYVYSAGLWREPEVKIRTAAGVKRGRLVSREGARFDFEFEMGEPGLASDEIPVVLDRPLARVVSHHLRLGGELIEVTCVSMGNPHCTLFFDDLDSVNIDEMGPLIEDHPAFPNRTNVEFTQVLSPDEIKVYFWERGVGRTLSSGTGSCGAAVASALNGFTGRSVRVHTGGGTLGVDWGEDNTIKLTGSAEVIYEGRWLRPDE